MILRGLGIAALFFFAVTPLVSAQEQDVLKLDELIQEALKNNPELRAARHQAGAARQQIRQAKAWDPPQIGVDFFQTPIQSFPSPTEDSMEVDYFVQQMFPFPGKLSAMTRSAESNAQMMEKAHLALENRVIRELKSAYYDLYFVQRKCQINAENQELMREFANTAKSQYEVGMGKQADILRAETELSTLINEGINLQQKKRSAEAMINTLLSRSTAEPLGVVPDIAETMPDFTFEQLKPLALENRPELHAMSQKIDMNTAELVLAKREYFPDIMFKVMYKDMADTSDDFWSTMVGVTVPLAFWSSGKFKGKVEESHLNIRKAEADYRTMENMVLYEVQDALVSVQTHRNLMMLYKEATIPQAEETLQSMNAAYQTGATDFFSLIDAFRMLLMARLDYHMSLMNYMASQAALEQAVGLRLEEICERLR